MKHDIKVLLYCLVFNVLQLDAMQRPTIPLAIILDSGNEVPTKCTNIYHSQSQALTTELAVHLFQNAYPLIVSSTILENIVTIRTAFNKEKMVPESNAEKLAAILDNQKYICINYASTPLQQSIVPHTYFKNFLEKYPRLPFSYFTTLIPFYSWDIFPIQNASEKFYICMPRNTFFNYNRELLPACISYNQLETNALEYTPQKIHSPAQNIFEILSLIKSSLYDPSLVIMLSGHGKYSSPTSISQQDDDGKIAELSLDEFKKLLLNLASIKIKGLYYDTCYGGGYHLEKPYSLPTTSKTTQPLLLPYGIISRCTDNGPSSTDCITMIADSFDETILIKIPFNPTLFFKEYISLLENKNINQKRLFKAARHALGNLEQDPQTTCIMFRPPFNNRFICLHDKYTHIVTNTVNINAHLKNLLLKSHIVNKNITTKEIPHFSCITPKGGTFFIRSLTVHSTTHTSIEEIIESMFFNKKILKNSTPIHLLIGTLSIISKNKSSIINNIYTKNNDQKTLLFKKDTTFYQAHFTTKLTTPITLDHAEFATNLFSSLIRGFPYNTPANKEEKLNLDAIHLYIENNKNPSTKTIWKFLEDT